MNGHGAYFKLDLSDCLNYINYWVGLNKHHIHFNLNLKAKDSLHATYANTFCFARTPGLYQLQFHIYKFYGYLVRKLSKLRYLHKGSRQPPISMNRQLPTPRTVCQRSERNDLAESRPVIGCWYFLRYYYMRCRHYIVTSSDTRMLSCQIWQNVGCACTGNAGDVFPATAG